MVNEIVIQAILHSHTALSSSSTFFNRLYHPSHPYKKTERTIISEKEVFTHTYSVVVSEHSYVDQIICNQ